MPARECVLIFGEAEKMNERNLGAPTQNPLTARVMVTFPHYSFAPAVLLLYFDVYLLARRRNLFTNFLRLDHIHIIVKNKIRHRYMDFN
jgi:hypothetical protein